LWLSETNFYKLLNDLPSEASARINSHKTLCGATISSVSWKNKHKSQLLLKLTNEQISAVTDWMKIDHIPNETEHGKQGTPANICKQKCDDDAHTVNECEQKCDAHNVNACEQKCDAHTVNACEQKCDAHTVNAFEQK
jgi:hypothetical protein